MPPGVYPRQKTPEQRFWENVDIADPDQCWIWKPSKSGKSRYGMFWDGARYLGPHKYSLQLSIGRPLSKDEWALHKCDNPSCVNPDHLFIGNATTNGHDCTAKGRRLKGSNNPSSKLTEEIVLQSRLSYASGDVSSSDLAAIHGVSGNAMLYALNGKTWKSVGGPIAHDKPNSYKFVSKKIRLVRASKHWHPRHGKTAKKSI